jgi:hypothetical protein
VVPQSHEFAIRWLKIYDYMYLKGDKHIHKAFEIGNEPIGPEVQCPEEFQLDNAVGYTSKL